MYIKLEALMVNWVRLAVLVNDLRKKLVAKARKAKKKCPDAFERAFTEVLSRPEFSVITDWTRARSEIGRVMASWKKKKERRRATGVPQAKKAGGLSAEFEYCPGDDEWQIIHVSMNHLSVIAEKSYEFAFTIRRQGEGEGISYEVVLPAELSWGDIPSAVRTKALGLAKEYFKKTRDLRAKLRKKTLRHPGQGNLF